MSESEKNGYVHLKFIPLGHTDVTQPIIVTRNVKETSKEIEFKNDMIFPSDQKENKFEASEGDVFTFKVKEDNDNLSFTKVTVKSLGETYTFTGGITLNNNSKETKAPKVQSNLYSFDITKITLFNIAISQKKQILKDLVSNDLDYRITGGIATKRQFDFKTINKGTSWSEAESHFSKSRFTKSLAVNVTGGVPIQAVSVSGGFGFEESKEKSFESEDTFLFKKVDIKKYSLELDHDKIDFFTAEEGDEQDDFVKSINKLPVPQKIYENGDDADQDEHWDEYKQFIEDFGTHYPTEVFYGGCGIFIETFKKEESGEITTHTTNMNAKVGAKGAEGGGSVELSSSSQFSTGNSAKESLWHFVGGEGVSGDSYSVKDDVEAVKLNLAKISDLIKYILPEETEELKKKRSLLYWAIEKYIESKSNDAPDPLIKTVEFEIRKMEIDSDWHKDKEVWLDIRGYLNYQLVDDESEVDEVKNKNKNVDYRLSKRVAPGSGFHSLLHRDESPVVKSDSETKTLYATDSTKEMYLSIYYDLHLYKEIEENVNWGNYSFNEKIDLSDISEEWTEKSWLDGSKKEFKCTYRYRTYKTPELNTEYDMDNTPIINVE